MPPVIGICAAVERVSWGAWREQEVVKAPRSYARAVQAAGGIALVLPPDPRASDSPDPFLDRLDALLLVGGADVDPAGYGAEPHPATGGTWPDRDRFERELVRGALGRGMPVLGTCRGMEMLNVACGGTLEQHLPDRIGSERHRSAPGEWSDHDVRLEPGSLAARAVGAERTTVRSHHHQGVDDLGEGLVPTGWSVDDAVIEAIEMRDHEFVLGVLWHPEEDEQSRVIVSLVETAQQPTADSRPRTGATP